MAKGKSTEVWGKYNSYTKCTELTYFGAKEDYTSERMLLCVCPPEKRKVSYILMHEKHKDGKTKYFKLSATAYMRNFLFSGI